MGHSAKRQLWNCQHWVFSNQHLHQFHWLECYQSRTLKNKFEECNLKGFRILGRKMFRKNLNLKSLICRHLECEQIFLKSQEFETSVKKYSSKVITATVNEYVEMKSWLQPLTQLLCCFCFQEDWVFLMNGSEILWKSKEWHWSRKRKKKKQTKQPLGL